MQPSKSKNIFVTAVFLLLFLAGLNFVNRVYYCVYLAIAVLLVYRKFNIVIDKSCLLLFIFGLAMLFFSELYGVSLTGLLKPFTFLFCHILGLSLVSILARSEDTCINDSTRAVEKIIVTLSLGMFTHFSANAVLNLNAAAGARNLNDIWSGSELSATGQAAVAALCIGVFIAALFADKKKSVKIFSFIGLIIIMAYNLRLAGRTLIGIAIIDFAIAFLYKFIKSGSDIKSKLKILFGVFAVIVAAVIIYSKNAWGIRSYIEHTNFYNRFFGAKAYMDNLGSDGRMTYKKLYLRYMLDYPWGKNALRNFTGGHYAHDLLLDIYSQGGVIAFVSILVYLIGAFWTCFKVLKTAYISFDFKLLLLCSYTSIAVIFFMEPIIDGMQWLLVSFCIINGALFKFNNSLKKEAQNKK